MSALQAAVGRLGRHMAERRAQRTHPVPATHTLRRVAPPEGTPHALFADRPLSQRTWCEDRPVRLSGCRQPLWYTGPALDVEDEAVLRWLLDRSPAEDGSVRFSATTCLRALGRGRGAIERQRLRRVLLRLQGAVLTRIAPDGSRQSHSLIEQACWYPTPRGRSGHWRVESGSEIRALFEPTPAATPDERTH